MVLWTSLLQRPASSKRQQKADEYAIAKQIQHKPLTLTSTTSYCSWFCTTVSVGAHRTRLHTVHCPRGELAAALTAERERFQLAVAQPLHSVLRCSYYSLSATCCAAVVARGSPRQFRHVSFTRSSTTSTDRLSRQPLIHPHHSSFLIPLYSLPTRLTPTPRPTSRAAMTSVPACTRTSVLVVGGGLVGLSARLFLHQLGVPAMLIEKELQPSPLPRSRGIHVRTMELFRQLGLEETVKQAAASVWQQGGFGGARRGPTVLQAESLFSKQDIQQMMKSMFKADPSPSAFGACPQTVLEPLLQRAVEERGGEVLWGHELVSFQDTGSEVEAKVRDRSGKESSITASYLIAADGGRSTVRRQLGIGSATTPADTHYINTYFRADLTEQVKDRTFSQCQIDNDRVSGLFTSMNNSTLWSFHLEYDKDNPPTYTSEQLIDLLHAAIGRTDVPIELLAEPTRWSTVVRVADRYRVGRVFLVGDAAHQWPSDGSATQLPTATHSSLRRHLVNSQCPLCAALCCLSVSDHGAASARTRVSQMRRT